MELVLDVQEDDGSIYDSLVSILVFVELVLDGRSFVERDPVMLPVSILVFVELVLDA